MRHPVAPKRKPPAPSPKPFQGKGGFDLMRGPEIRTRPATLKPPFIPGTGMGVGMSKPL